MIRGGVVLLSPEEVLGFCLWAFVYFAEGLVGMTRNHLYYSIGFPLGKLVSSEPMVEFIARVQGNRTVKLFGFALQDGSGGLRYKYLGNWLPSFIKASIRTEQPGELKIRFNLNWATTLLLGALLYQSIVRDGYAALVWQLMLWVWLYFLWIQYSEIRDVVRGAQDACRTDRV
jgi:hypothetical protein